MAACKCGRAVRFVPSVGFYGHVDPLPRGRGHYVRLLSTSAPRCDGRDAEAGGPAERFPERGSGRSEPVKAG